MTYQPPFTSSAKTLNLIASISEQLTATPQVTQQATPQAGELNPVALSSGIFVQKECNR